MNFLLPAFFRN